MAPFFLAYGLVKEASIRTEALATVVTHVVKLVAYGRANTLSGSATATGLALGPLMIAGSYAGQRSVARVAEALFVAAIETTMVGAGVLFLVRG